ncbi:hypothetical protein [Candidatus Chlamydia corallus]|uniref:hypothetical protein n=1 Tax=Candidatus Chlamydia corallus TaxID=2038470 RepID=UPI000C2F9948|nr:hypothetical protein [Candidatus Chlamydia corallus]
MTSIPQTSANLLSESSFIPDSEQQPIRHPLPESAQLAEMATQLRLLSDTVIQQQRERTPTTAPVIIQVASPAAGRAPTSSLPTPGDEPHPRPPVPPAQIESELASLRAELTLIRSTLQQSAKGTRTGVLVVTAILMTISLLAIIIIVLAVLGFTGVLPQVALLLQSNANLIWAMVSASIICFISLIGTLGLILTNKNTPIRPS